MPVLQPRRGDRARGAESTRAKLRLVYRDYPLPNHALAPKAAEAAHCAGDQGKYWEMHDRLFAATPKLEVTDLKAYARDLKLDEGRFDKCLDSGEKAKVVADHFKAGNDAGVRGTPAFFINGRPHLRRPEARGLHRPHRRRAGGQK